MVRIFFFFPIEYRYFPPVTKLKKFTKSGTDQFVFGGRRLFRMLFAENERCGEMRRRLKFRFPNFDRTVTYRFYDLSVSLPSTETIDEYCFQAWPRVLRLLVWKSYGTRRRNSAGRWNLMDWIVESTASRMARCFRDFPPIFSLPSFSLSCISSLALSLFFDRIGWFFDDILDSLFKFVKL